MYTLDWHTGFPYDAVNANQRGCGFGGFSTGSPTISPSVPAWNGDFTFAVLTSACVAFWRMPQLAGTRRSLTTVVDSPEFGTFQ